MWVAWIIPLAIHYVMWRRVHKKDQKQIEILQKVVEDRDRGIVIYDALVEDYNRMVEVDAVFASVLHHCSNCKKRVADKFKQAEESKKLKKVGEAAYKTLKNTF